MTSICDICSLIESHNDFKHVIVTSLLKKGTYWKKYIVRENMEVERMNPKTNVSIVVEPRSDEIGVGEINEMTGKKPPHLNRLIR
ncbi:hypothetical protein HID58_013513 [Brassica napus]|uniref:Uncharacterized protein n=1 Tax=Brassica napus TaxID=3708 RepID=A0ABQ8E6V7_BRANA|nr:hypothetical protein HID58_013513 [Brassica napus]